MVVTPIIGQVTVALRTGDLELCSQISLKILPSYLASSSLCIIFFITSGVILQSLDCLAIYLFTKYFLSWTEIVMVSLWSFLAILQFSNSFIKSSKMSWVVSNFYYKIFDDIFTCEDIWFLSQNMAPVFYVVCVWLHLRQPGI